MNLWWMVARSSGLVAWALATASVLWGMALSTRALGRKPPAPWLLDLHRFLGALTVVFVAVHLLGLWMDSYVHFGLSELFVPFAATWKPDAVAWGIVGLYLLLAVEITSLLMKRMPRKVWKKIHYLSYGLYLTATVHMVTAGSDASNPAIWAIAVSSVTAVLFFTIYLIIGPGKRGSVQAPNASRTGEARSERDRDRAPAAHRTPRPAGSGAARPRPAPAANASPR